MSPGKMLFIPTKEVFYKAGFIRLSSPTSGLLSDVFSQIRASKYRHRVLIVLEGLNEFSNRPFIKLFNHGFPILM